MVDVAARQGYRAGLAQGAQHLDILLLLSARCWPAWAERLLIGSLLNDCLIGNQLHLTVPRTQVPHRLVTLPSGCIA